MQSKRQQDAAIPMLKIHIFLQDFCIAVNAEQSFTEIQEQIKTAIHITATDVAEELISTTVN